MTPIADALSLAKNEPMAAKSGFVWKRASGCWPRRGQNILARSVTANSPRRREVDDAALLLTGRHRRTVRRLNGAVRIAGEHVVAKHAACARNTA